jgi:putative ABC transport system permease protein
MIRNYMKIAFRALWRSKGHSIINILGLSLGIGCCVLISLYVYDEWTFDTFHSKAERIFRVYGREDWGENQQFSSSNTPFPMGPALKENLPEVESQVRINKIGTQVRVGDQMFSETLNIVGQDFFRVFDFEIVKGEGPAVLSNASNIVLTDWAAKKYFGDDDPIGKVISVQLGENFEEFKVAAVTRNLPSNSSITYYLLISDLNFPKLYSERALTSAWFNISPETYVLLQDGVDYRTVESKFPSLFRTILGEEDYKASKYSPGLQPLTTIHLDTSYPGGDVSISDPKYSYILVAIALLILVVGCINFVTLSVGRSLRRAKEVGIRKVVGAQRRQLITQFIGEAIIVTAISMVVGMAMAAGTLTTFNELASKRLAFPLDGFLLLVVTSLLVVIGLIAGSYPAFILSSFRPITILKGAVQSGSSKQGMRRVLVGVQLVLSIFLISSTLVMRDQLDFLQRKNLGFNKEQLAVVQLNVPRGGRMPERVQAGFVKAEQFKLELARVPEIKAVAAASHDFGNGGWVNVGYTDDGNTYRTFDMLVVDDEYIPVMRMEMAQGRNFSDANPADARRSVIVNEAFAREYGWTDAVGKKLPGKNFLDHEVIGVVKDFNYTSLYTKVPPLVILQSPAIILAGMENINVGNTPVPKLFLRLEAGSTALALDKVNEIWDKITGGEEFAFSFVDQALAEQYRSDQNLGRIVGVATVLAIIIGSLGLYGLASLAMQNRTKEISIRKVMGATERSLLMLLSRDYVVLIVVCLVLSVPATIYAMQGWLSSFEYRVSIGWGVFAFAGGISLVIAFATIGYQTLKTAWTQPAEALKYE